MERCDVGSRSFPSSPVFNYRDVIQGKTLKLQNTETASNRLHNLQLHVHVHHPSSPSRCPLLYMFVCLGHGWVGYLSYASVLSTCIPRTWASALSNRSPRQLHVHVHLYTGLEDPAMFYINQQVIQVYRYTCTCSHTHVHVGYM